MEYTEIITLLKDIAIGVSAAVVAFVALRGLHTWKNELIGKSSYKVARDLILATYNIRDRINEFRQRFFPIDEFPDGYDPTGFFSPKTTAQAWRHVYGNRFQPVLKAVKKFNVKALDAEALWGDQIKEKTNNLRQCEREIRTATEAVISNYASDGENFRVDREFEREMKEIISASPNDENNLFSQKLKTAVSEIEKIARPHLARK